MMKDYPMSDTANFRSLLDQDVTEVERPKPLPTGSYVFTVSDYKFDKSSKKKTDFTQFEVTPTQALDDVDQEELAAVLAVGDKTLTDKKMKLDYYMTPEAMWRLDEFLLDHLGHEGGKRSVMIEASKGMQFVGMIGHETSDRDENVKFARIVSFAKYDG